MNRLSPRAVLAASIAVIAVLWALQFADALFHIIALEGRLGLNLAGNIGRTSLVLLLRGLITIAFICAALRLSGQGHADIGFQRSRLGRQVAIGALFGLGIFALQTFLLNPLLESMFPMTAAESDSRAAMFARAANLPLLLALGIFKGGFLEEYWRIFVLTRFERAFSRFGLIAALVIGSVVFGLGHSYQGTAAIFSIAVVGLAYALVYLRKRRAVEAIAAHATFDVVAIILGFLIYYGK